VSQWTESRIGWSTFAITSIAYLATTSYRDTYNSDVQAAVVPAAQIASTGLPWLDSLNLGSGNPFFITAGEHVVSNRPIGISLLAVPVYLAVGSPLAIWPSAVAAALATALAVTLMHLAVRRVVGPTAALAATVVFAFGTPTWTVSADGLWGHTVTQLSIAAASFAASRSRWLWTGVCLGFGIMGRPHVAVIALAVGLMVGWRLRSMKPVLLVGAGSATGALLLLGLNRWIYDRWTLTGYGSYVTDNLTKSDAWSVPDIALNLAGFFVAPERGLLVWTPIALLLLPSAVRMSRSAQPWVLAFAVGGLAYTAVQLRINWFHGVDAFWGYRLALELVTCLVPLYALAWESVRSAVLRGIVAFMAVLQIAAMTIGGFRTNGFLSVYEVWQDNSVAWLIRFGLRTDPAPYTVLIAAVLALGGLAARRAVQAEQRRARLAASAGAE
jgi:alpha-1,2-mannosyltransferase